jgi:hypothetical protein
MAARTLDNGARPVGWLADGTAYYAPLGELVRDGDERVRCHLCGRFMRMLGGTHLRVTHGWSIDEYREAFQLREGVPTCSRELSGLYREQASERVGERGFATPPVDPPRPRRRPPAWRSLAELRPDIAVEIHPAKNPGVDSAAIAAGSRLKIWWRCAECDHEWEASIANRTLRNSSCPACGVRRRARTQESCRRRAVACREATGPRSGASPNPQR